MHSYTLPFNNFCCQNSFNNVFKFFFFPIKMLVSCTTSFVEGGLAAATAGGSFTPHVIAVEIGEVS